MTEALKTTATVPMLDVRAAPVAASYDEKNRTVDFIASTGARGLRRSYWSDDYYEELEISESAIRMDRLNNGAPFLNSHNAWGVSNVLGSIQRSWVEDGKLMIRVKFSQRDEVQPILQDIRDGVLAHVSVGYYVHQYDVTEKAGELDVRRAVDWEPAEVSIVPIGFDDGATVRSSEQKVSQAVINRSPGAISKEVAMTDAVRKDETPAENQAPENAMQTRSGGDMGNGGGTPPVAAASPASPEDVRAAADEAVRNERERITEIRRAVRTARLGEDLADTLISEGVTVDAARARIIDEWSKQDHSEETTTVRTSVDHSVMETVREHAVDAILTRAGIQSGKAVENNGFRNMTLLRLCEDLLQRQGVDVRNMSAMQLAARALSTSDLTHITGSVMNRTLLQGYESAPRTFVGVFRQASAQDFREINRVRLSDAPALDEVKEAGEFKYGSVSDEKESYALVTYGKILPFTRQTIINDDLDALVRVPTMFGRAAADKESDIVWNILVANAALQDGTALFHADHNNLGSALAITVASVGAARAAMRKQTSIQGRVINVMPRFIICGADKETELDQLLTNITPATQANAVPQSLRSLTPVVEPRLTGNAWYVAADFNQVDTVEYCYLSGANGVYIETREGFNIDGIEVKARHDFAAKAIDFRGLYKNPGA